MAIDYILLRLVGFLTLSLKGICEVSMAISGGDLVCGSQVTLNCYTSPLADIRWERDGSLLNNCFTSGSCTFQDDSSYSFSLNTTSSVYQLTISTLTYTDYNENVFLCSTSTESDSTRITISVPLTNITLTYNKNNGAHELLAATNCIKATDPTSLSWLCQSETTNEEVDSSQCNISKIVNSEDNTTCTSGGDCSGSGITKKQSVLTFQEYDTGSDIQPVRLVISASSITMTSDRTFNIKKVASTSDDGESFPEWLKILLIVIGILLVGGGVILVIYCCKTANGKQTDPNAQILPKSEKPTDRVNTDSLGSDNKSNLSSSAVEMEQQNTSKSHHIEDQSGVTNNSSIDQQTTPRIENNQPSLSGQYNKVMFNQQPSLSTGNQRVDNITQIINETNDKSEPSKPRSLTPIDTEKLSHRTNPTPDHPKKKKKRKKVTNEEQGKQLQEQHVE